MTNLTQNMQDLIESAAESEDQTQTSGGGDFTYEVPPSGQTTARLIEYIEIGKRKQRPFAGKPKPDCEEVRLTFELLSKKHEKEIEVNGELKVIYNKFSITLPKKLNDRAKFTKLFKLMDYGRGNKHMAQMLGDAFVITLFHNVVEKDGKTTTYVNLNPAGGDYAVKAPVSEDMDTGEVTQMKVAPANSPIKLFLWDNPTPETWTSLYIDGTRTKKNDKGEEVEVSKNWMQEMIQGATDYKGSALETMLLGADDIPEFQVEEVQEEVAVKKPKNTAKAAESQKEEASSVAVDGTTDPEQDPLAALGLA